MLLWPWLWLWLWLRLRTCDDADAAEAAYVAELDRMEAESADFILVDGIYRDYCAQKAIRVLRPGGLLVIDNVNRYLPSDSHAPRSRSRADGPKTRTWQAVYDVIGSWRMIWTSSGVGDTALFFKPNQ